MRFSIIAVLLFASIGWADEPVWSIGSANQPLADGARALLGDRYEEGIRLTLIGLKIASNKKEEEIALSNLCAGYTNMGDYSTALKYCDMLQKRNDGLWRVHASKALIYVYTKQYGLAEESLIKGESLNPGAHSLKVARALYLDATQPVQPEIHVDDRQNREQ
ncbi:MAG: hypothetical protein R3192_17515 [Woeseiaceae bacterium]|nr:hypothetical protein [Woeseiaceae bacterium]